MKILLFLTAATLFSQTPREADSALSNFRFASGERLPKLNLHYTTLGSPKRDAQGRVSNAVLILHGTGGSGHQFLGPEFSGVLFQPGQLLDASKYFITCPTTSARASLLSQATACTPASRITATRTWSQPNTAL